MAKRRPVESRFSGSTSDGRMHLHVYDFVFRILTA